MKLFLFALASREDPAWVYVVVLGGLGLLGFLNWLRNRIFPSTKRQLTSAGNALMRVEANFLPGGERIVEAREKKSVEEDDRGEPPEAGR